jgi:hypothetical protein
MIGFARALNPWCRLLFGDRLEPALQIEIPARLLALADEVIE